ncbi:valine-tRNA ligase, partial [Kipferlia bialata]
NMGCALDWSREVFTMDDPRSEAHNEAFIRLFEDKKIYRDDRLVNWDCVLQTAISDIEIDYIE